MRRTLGTKFGNFQAAYNGNEESTQNTEIQQALGFERSMIQTVVCYSDSPIRNEF